MSDHRRRGVPPRSKKPADNTAGRHQSVSPDGEELSDNAAGRRVYDGVFQETGYFRPEDDVADLRGNLPHWRQEAVTYFVTFRLADSLPQARLQQWLCERDEWLATHPKPWDDAIRNLYHRQFTAKFEKWLDAGHGSCLLARRDVRDVVTGALRHFEGSRYWLDAWVVMPTHVHVVVTPTADYELSRLLHTWKSFTSHAIGALVPDWRGPIWQKESFDHIIRGPDHLERFRLYIARNPLGLPADSYTLSCDVVGIEEDESRKTPKGARHERP